MISMPDSMAFLLNPSITSSGYGLYPKRLRPLERAVSLLTPPIPSFMVSSLSREPRDYIIKIFR